MNIHQIYEKASARRVKKGALHPRDVEKFLRAYLETAIWASTDPDTERPLDRNWDIGDFTKESVERARRDAIAFIKAHHEDLDAVADYEQHGHDFFLTRNRHGAGFWDRGYGQLGERLSRGAHGFGQASVIPHRGKLHFYP